MILGFLSSDRRRENLMLDPGGWRKHASWGDYQIPASNDAVRAWRAPRAGRVRVQGWVYVQADDGRSGRAAILKNALEAWPSMSLRNGEGASYDFVVRVDKGDFLFFDAGRGTGQEGVS